MYDIHKHPEKLAKTNKNIKQRNLAPGESAEDQPSKQLFFKYCKADEVNRKRHIFCLFKATFEAKLIKMKSKGQKLELVERLSQWIEEYVESEDCSELVAKMGCCKTKSHFKKELLDLAEKLISDRHHRIAKKHLNELKEYSSPKVNYQKKVNYLESKIENDMEFFDDSAVPDEFLKLKIKLRRINAAK